MILVRECNPQDSAIEVIANGERSAKVAALYAHMGQLAAAGMHPSDGIDAYTQTFSELARTGMLADGRGIFEAENSLHKNQHQLPTLGLGAAELILQNSLLLHHGEDFLLLDHNGMSADESFKPYLYKVHELFAEDELVGSLATHANAPYIGTRYLVPKDRAAINADREYPEHSAIGRMDHVGEFEPVFTIFDSSVVQ